MAVKLKIMKANLLPSANRGMDVKSMGGICPCSMEKKYPMWFNRLSVFILIFRTNSHFLHTSDTNICFDFYDFIIYAKLSAHWSSLGVARACSGWSVSSDALQMALVLHFSCAVPPMSMRSCEWSFSACGTSKAISLSRFFHYLECIECGQRHFHVVVYQFRHKWKSQCERTTFARRKVTISRVILWMMHRIVWSESELQKTNNCTIVFVISISVYIKFRTIPNRIDCLLWWPPQFSCTIKR